ncbi:MAG: glycosyltransferase family 2 protein [Anaerolineae bacterium]
MIKLSICIPTYNRAFFLKQTLDSILLQIRPGVEVVIHDNASQDETASLIQDYRKRLPLLRYGTFSENVGFDRNILRCVEMARGQYCWLMGSDDCIEQGGLETVLSCLHRHPDLSGMTTGYNIYSSAMKKIATGPALFDHDRLFKNFEESIEHLFLHFGLLSTQVVKKTLWQEAARQDDLHKYFMSYVHVYLITKILESSPRWMALQQRCVGWRSGNDSFLQNGYFRRLEIDAKGYEAILSTFFAKQHPLYRKTLAKVGKVHLASHVKAGRWASSEKKFRRRSLLLCFNLFKSFSIFWLRLAPLLLAPLIFLKGVRWIKSLFRSRPLQN